LIQFSILARVKSASTDFRGFLTLFRILLVADQCQLAAVRRAEDERAVHVAINT